MYMSDVGGLPRQESTTFPGGDRPSGSSGGRFCPGYLEVSRLLYFEDYVEEVCAHAHAVFLLQSALWGSQAVFGLPGNVRDGARR